MNIFMYPIKTKHFVNLIQDYNALELTVLEKTELDFFLLSETPLKSNYMVDKRNNRIRFLKLLDNFSSSKLSLMTHSNVCDMTELCFICLTEYQNDKIEKFIYRLKFENKDYQLH